MTTIQTLAKIRTQIKGLNKDDRIEVFWVDAGDLDTSENFTWIDQKEAIKGIRSIPVRTIGYFLAFRTHNLLLCHNIEFSDKKAKSVANRGIIPLGCITRIIKLKEVLHAK
tara:strand:- start:534 stop:866 length:333 start_codon:yes stop_codon:yes gene_type:complete